MNFDYDHDRFVSKNKSIARGYEVDRGDDGMAKKGFSRFDRQEDASCFTCKLRPKCSEFRSRRSGGTAGVVSYGGGEKFICDRFTPVPAGQKSMSDKQIKSLLKNTKRGR